MIRRVLIIFGFFAVMVSCQENKTSAKKEIWVYTSMYKDTIADLTPKLEKDFPDIKIKWFQAGSEEIATKVNAEILTGQTRADLLISSDRFWYEEMANTNRLHAYSPKAAKGIPAQLKHPQGKYHTLSIPVMVLTYNKDVLDAQQAPKSFKELADEKWKGQFTTGSPLSSGTNFTTMAMLQHHYGWDYFKKLKENATIAQGGNSAVIRRLQNKERKVGWVLLENLLRFQGKDDRLQIVFPKDGVVTHANVMAITNKKGERQHIERLVDWLLSEKGQLAMTRSYMYSPLAKYAPPIGAPKLESILDNAFPWTKNFLENVTEKRAEIKEKYTEIMFQ
jgi:iron(III) transport system substrate-binding protein